MSESEARSVTSSAGLPWKAKGKPLWEEWKKSQGKSPETSTISHFARYVQRNREAKPLEDLSESEDDEFSLEEEIRQSIAAESRRTNPQQKSLPSPTASGKGSTQAKDSVATGLLNLARTLTGTEEEEHEEADEESRKLLSKAISARHKPSRTLLPKQSSLRKTALEEEKAKEETSDFISMMPSSKRSSASSGGSGKSEKATFFDEMADSSSDDDEGGEGSYGQFDSAQDTTATLASIAMEAIQSNSHHPAKMLQYLSTRSGQNRVLDHLESCCMSKIHADYKRFSKTGPFDHASQKMMSKGCEHFSGIRSEDQYKSLSELHSQLKHAASDDVVSSVFAECAEEAFDDIADMAIDAYHHNADAENSPYHPISKNVETEMDISKISDDDLDAITRNYHSIAQPFAYGLKNANAFAFWGYNAIQEANKENVYEKAKKIVQDVVDYLRDEDKGVDDEHGIFLGYQCAVANLIYLLADISEAQKTDMEKYEMSKRAEVLLQAISTAAYKDPTEEGHLGGALENFATVTQLGRTGGREKRTRRRRRGKLREAFRSARRGASRGAQRVKRTVSKRALKIVTSGESSYLIDTIQKCAEEFATRKMNKLSKMSEMELSSQTKNEIAKELMQDFLANRVERDAEDLVSALPAIGKGVAPSMVTKYTLQVISITAAYFFTKRTYGYAGRTSDPFKENILDVSGVLPSTMSSLTKKIYGYRPGKALARALKQEAKGTGKAAKKGGKWARKKFKERVEVTTPTVTIKGPGKSRLSVGAHTPHPDLSAEDKKLEEHERAFLRRAILEAIDYSQVMNAQGISTGRALVDPSAEPQYSFVIVIPEQRKFRNEGLRKVTTDHPYRWVFEKPSVSSDSDTTINTARRPAIHDVWISLPSADEPDFSLHSKGRFRFRFYPRTNRLERMVRVDDSPPPKHSSYIDKEGNVVRLTTNRDKKHIYVSHTFDPEDEVSDQMLSGLEKHVPPNVHITFRRSFG